ncbi:MULTISPECIES: response regulator [Emticicia]|uniref:response regulator n=1 Tax=Emticicia TaxID=312278 RepID=UPI00209E7CCC|nr:MULTISPECIES: response regulator [Emticicia]UTA66852.1 response regulator [Emticicia sp. 21SJ11W-3]
MNFNTILLIDDDDDDQEIFLTAVKQISSSVRYFCFNSGREALHKLSLGEIQPEVIFLDLNMPLMSGQEFLYKIKQKDTLAHIPVIILSTSADPNTRELTIDLGAHMFITKPGDFGQLVEILTPLIS